MITRQIVFNRQDLAEVRVMVFKLIRLWR